MPHILSQVEGCEHGRVAVKKVFGPEAKGLVAHMNTEGQHRGAVAAAKAAAQKAHADGDKHGHGHKHEHGHEHEHGHKHEDGHKHDHGHNHQHAVSTPPSWTVLFEGCLL